LLIATIFLSPLLHLKHEEQLDALVKDNIKIKRMIVSKGGNLEGFYIERERNWWVEEEFKKRGNY